MTDLPALIAALDEAVVRFIVVGGMAGIAHGAARVTFDVDCVYSPPQAKQPPDSSGGCLMGSSRTYGPVGPQNQYR